MMAATTGHEPPVLHKELLDQPLPDLSNTYSIFQGPTGLFNFNLPPPLQLGMFRPPIFTQPPQFMIPPQLQPNGIPYHINIQP